MGKHNFMRVMINGKKLHTTGSFNKNIMKELDDGKWPDEISYGCTLEQIKSFANNSQTSILVTMLFYKRHICKSFRTLERVNLSEYRIDENGSISRGEFNYSVYPMSEQRFCEDSYLRGYFTIPEDAPYNEMIHEAYLRLISTNKPRRYESVVTCMQKIFSHQYTAFYYDPSQDGSPWDTNELIVKGKHVCNITECRTADKLEELEPPENRPTMQLVMIVKTKDMDRYEIVNHNPCPEEF